MGLLNRKKNKAPRAARTAKGKRQAKGKKPGVGSRVQKASRDLIDSYTGGAASTLSGGKGGGEGGKRRRINPMNAKAVRRASTRVRGAIKMLERLKKSLPHVTAKGKVTVRKR